MLPPQHTKPNEICAVHQRYPVRVQVHTCPSVGVAPCGNRQKSTPMRARVQPCGQKMLQWRRGMWPKR
jgi:hypothetical protein